MIRDLRTRIGHVVGLIHAIHDDVCNATAMPRRLSLVEARCAGAIGLVAVSNLWRVALERDRTAKAGLVSDKFTCKFHTAFNWFPQHTTL